RPDLLGAGDRPADVGHAAGRRGHDPAERDDRDGTAVLVRAVSRDGRALPGATRGATSRRQLPRDVAGLAVGTSGTEPGAGASALASAPGPLDELPGPRRGGPVPRHGRAAGADGGRRG